jgi:hypothetical protein
VTHIPEGQMSFFRLGVPSTIFARLHSRIGFRLLAGVLLFSFVVTLTLTLLQLYLDYRRDIAIIQVIAHVRGLLVVACCRAAAILS